MKTSSIRSQGANVFHFSFLSMKRAHSPTLVDERRQRLHVRLEQTPVIFSAPIACEKPPSIVPKGMLQGSHASLLLAQWLVGAYILGDKRAFVAILHIDGRRIVWLKEARAFLCTYATKKWVTVEQETCHDGTIVSLFEQRKQCPSYCRSWRYMNEANFRRLLSPSYQSSRVEGADLPKVWQWDKLTDSWTVSNGESTM